jgi:hypothetical protein
MVEYSEEKRNLCSHDYLERRCVLVSTEVAYPGEQNSTNGKHKMETNS